MAGVTTAIATSYKQEILQALHNHTITTGHVFKVALFVGTATIVGTFGAATTNYSQMGSDELATAGGYTRPGFAWTAAQNITPSTSGTSAFTQWSTNPQWTSATFTTSGCLIYNSTAGGNAVELFSFGGNEVILAGTFTLNLPANGVGTSLIQVN